MAPIVADAEAGFGGALNAFELMKAMIEAGAAGVHFEDQLASEKKCGHLGGKVLVPIAQHIRTLNAARLAADVEGVADRAAVPNRRAFGAAAHQRHRRARPPVHLRRAHRRRLLPHQARPRVEYAIARSLAFAPYADLLWWETSEPDLGGGASDSPTRSIGQFPGKMLAYNCSPSFNWQQEAVAGADRQLPARHRPMGYRFQFVTLAGFHA